MTSPITGPLTRPDQVAVSALLTEAFEADPAYAYFLSGCSPTKKDHYRALLIRFVVAYHCQSGMPVWGTTLNGQLVACALVEAPGPEWRRALALLWQLPRLIGRVPLYEHLGFQLHDQLTLDSLKIYRMYRPLK